MTQNDEIRCALEFREDDTRQSPGRLFGTLLTYGEAAKQPPGDLRAGRPGVARRGDRDPPAARPRGAHHARGARAARRAPW